MDPAKPIVLVPACNRLLGDHPFHIVGKKYIDAVRLAGCQPLVVPGALPGELDGLLDLAHGVLLTGSPSNVHPSHFGEAVLDPTLPLDPERDALTLPLIRRVVERGMPLMAICRGAQETNVALGGSLHQAVHVVGPYVDHRAVNDESVVTRYGLAHEVTVEPGGVLEELLGRRTFQVNSVHGQAVNRLAEGLRVEARAHDGLVEAFSVDSAPGFVLAVQWHPEWLAETQPEAMRLFETFGRACSAYRATRARPRGMPAGESPAAAAAAGAAATAGAGAAASRAAGAAAAGRTAAAASAAIGAAASAQRGAAVSAPGRAAAGAAAAGGRGTGAAATGTASAQAGRGTAHARDRDA